MTVSLKVIPYNPNNKSKWFLFLYLLGIVCLFTSVLFDYSFIYIVISFTLIVFVYLYASFFNKDEKLGNLILDNTDINIKTKEVDLHFSLKEIENLIIKYGGFEGRPNLNIKSFSPYSTGVNNFIEFSKDSIEYKFRIKITQTELNLIKRIFKEWSLNDIQYKVEKF